MTPFLFLLPVGLGIGVIFFIINNKQQKIRNKTESKKLIKREFGNKKYIEKHFSSTNSTYTVGNNIKLSYEKSLRIIGSMGSGKTFYILTPLINNHHSFAIITSSKVDILHLTNNNSKNNYIFDPQELITEEHQLFYWDIIHDAKDYKLSELIAGTLIKSYQKTNSTTSQFFNTQSQIILTILLYISETFSDFLIYAFQLSDKKIQEKILNKLKKQDIPHLDTKLNGIFGTAKETFTSVHATLINVVNILSQKHIIDYFNNAKKYESDIFKLIKSKSKLYIFGQEDSTSLTSLITTFIEVLLYKIDKHTVKLDNKKYNPPILLCLDELANICPIPSLKQRVSEGRGKGICVVYALQAWASMVEKYNYNIAKQLDGYTNATLIMPGLNEIDFLNDISRKIGKSFVDDRSTTRHRGVYSLSNRQVKREIMPVEELRQVEKPVLLVDNMKPVMVDVENKK